MIYHPLLYNKKKVGVKYSVEVGGVNALLAAMLALYEKISCSYSLASNIFCIVSIHVLHQCTCFKFTVGLCL